MAHSYTPGLRVAEQTKIEKYRQLPTEPDKTNVLVKKGEKVSAEKIVLRSEMPGNVQPVNVANLLQVPPQDVPGLLKKSEGAAVQKDEIIAESKGLFGLFRSVVKSPITGFIESVSAVTGQMMLREPPVPIELAAYVDGLVTEVTPDREVTIETHGVFIQGIFGIGGEAVGNLRMIAKDPTDVTEVKDIPSDAKGQVLVGGAYASLATVRKAIEVGAAGLVIGGFSNSDLKELLGYEQGVAITGTEQIGITLILTEGFGNIAMADPTFKLFTKYNGRKASINGATQIRAGVIRPEVVIPHSEKAVESIHTVKGLEIGDVIRVIREPYFGQIGKVVSLPPELQVLESEAKVRVMVVELKGKHATVPRANVEVIES
ncbi:MAG: hypothetical protein OEM52_01660 [bacterium]|nr:hypothetical protein [bacterium]